MEATQTERYGDRWFHPAEVLAMLFMASLAVTFCLSQFVNKRSPLPPPPPPSPPFPVSLTGEVPWGTQLPEGVPAPDLRVPAIVGEESFNLSDYRGVKPVMLVFGSFT